MIIIKPKENRDYADRFTPLICGVIVISTFFIIIALIVRNVFDCEGDMFSFSGAIIGGGMTLSGVIFTIMYQEIKLDEARKENEAKRKEELAAQYRPILVHTVGEDIYDLPIIYRLAPGELVNIDDTNNIFIVAFNLYNIGRAEANNLNITKILLKNSIDYIELPIRPNIPEIEIVKNSGVYFAFVYYLDKKIIYILDKASEDSLTSLEVSITFEDIYKNIQSTKLCVAVSTVRLSKETNTYIFDYDDCKCFKTK